MFVTPTNQTITLEDALHTCLTLAEQYRQTEEGRAMAARFPEGQEQQRVSLQLVAELWEALDFRRSVQEALCS